MKNRLEEAKRVGINNWNLQGYMLSVSLANDHPRGEAAAPPGNPRSRLSLRRDAPCRDGDCNDVLLSSLWSCMAGE
jgi:hypothetical protein